MNYPEVLEYLSRTNEFQGMRLGLENTRTLYNHLPIRDSHIPLIQVAGSNGKGSTCYLLASIFKTAGYKVGLFTSPHVKDIRERIAVNNNWISAEDFAATVTTVKETAENLISKGLLEHMPTYFEFTFLTAMCYFSRENVDVAVLEVGLGGRLDATSIITPSVCVITSISLEHTHILGKTLGEIAKEKAGIIKPHVPIVCGCNTRSTAHKVIKKVAMEKEAPFHNVTDTRNRLLIDDTTSRINPDLPAPSETPYTCVYETKKATYNYEVFLQGKHQTYNAATAIKTIEVLTESTLTPRNLKTISPDAIKQGIASATVPARIEILKTSPKVILDGGHNMESITALANFLNQKKLTNLTLIFGVLADKNYKKMIELIQPYIAHVIITEPHSPRALAAPQLVKIFKKLNTKNKKNQITVEIKMNIDDAYQTAINLGNHILVTGSFYLVGAIREFILNLNKISHTSN